MNASWGTRAPEESNTRLGHQQYELVLKVGEHEVGSNEKCAKTILAFLIVCPFS